MILEKNIFVCVSGTSLVPRDDQTNFRVLQRQKRIENEIEGC
jgi:hypothetical protein